MRRDIAVDIASGEYGGAPRVEIVGLDGPFGGHREPFYPAHGGNVVAAGESKRLEAE